MGGNDDPMRLSVHRRQDRGFPEDGKLKGWFIDEAIKRCCSGKKLWSRVMQQFLVKFIGVMLEYFRYFHMKQPDGCHCLPLMAERGRLACQFVPDLVQQSGMLRLMPFKELAVFRRRNVVTHDAFFVLEMFGDKIEKIKLEGSQAPMA
jgi:hypothetical protein